MAGVNYRPIVSLRNSPRKSMNAVCHIRSRPRRRSSQEDHCSPHTTTHIRSRPAMNYCQTITPGSPAATGHNAHHTPMHSGTHFEHASPSEDTPHDSLPSPLRCQAPANLHQINASENHLSHAHSNLTYAIPRTRGRGHICTPGPPCDRAQPLGQTFHTIPARTLSRSLSPSSPGSHSTHPALNYYVPHPDKSSTIYSAPKHATRNALGSRTIHTAPPSTHTSTDNKGTGMGTTQHCTIPPRWHGNHRKGLPRVQDQSAPMRRPQGTTIANTPDPGPEP
jgi:hypothetical protein